MHMTVGISRTKVAFHNGAPMRQVARGPPSGECDVGLFMVGRGENGGRPHTYRGERQLDCHPTPEENPDDE